jgi:hypothetical protein
MSFLLILSHGRTDALTDCCRRKPDGGGVPPIQNFADLYWCLRLFLQRCPEFQDEQAYAEHHVSHLRRLAKSFLDSEDFSVVWPGAGDLLPDITVMGENNGFKILVQSW